MTQALQISQMVLPISVLNCEYTLTGPQAQKTPISISTLTLSEKTFSYDNPLDPEQTKHLQRFLKRHHCFQHTNSYIRDTMDFINKISNIALSHNSILATCDIVSLYTKINTNRGLKNITKNLCGQKNFAAIRILAYSFFRSWNLFSRAMFLSSTEYISKHKGSAWAPNAHPLMLTWFSLSLKRSSCTPYHRNHYAGFASSMTFFLSSTRPP